MAADDGELAEFSLNISYTPVLIKIIHKLQRSVLQPPLLWLKYVLAFPDLFLNVILGDCYGCQHGIWRNEIRNSINVRAKDIVDVQDGQNRYIHVSLFHTILLSLFWKESNCPQGQRGVVVKTSVFLSRICSNVFT